MKIIECKDPINEAHKAAMIIAFNTGDQTTVENDEYLPFVYIIQGGEKIARFERC